MDEAFTSTACRQGLAEPCPGTCCPSCPAEDKLSHLPRPPTVPGILSGKPMMSLLMNRPGFCREAPVIPFPKSETAIQ